MLTTHQILKDLTGFLLKHDPTNELLDYNGKDTDTYKTVSKWCNVKTDLKEDKDENLRTDNGILYDPNKDAFVSLNEVHLQYIFISNIIMKYIPQLKLENKDYGEFDIISSYYFKPDILSNLIDKGYLSKPLDLQKELLDDC